MWKNKISLFTLGSLILGIIFGLLFPALTDRISFLGSWYINILKLLIAPVVFTGISVAINASRKKKSHLVVKTVAVFVIMFVSCFLLSSFLVTILDPSKGFVYEDTAWTGSTQQITLGSFLVNLLPKSFKDIYMGSKLFFILIVAYLTGMLTGFDKSDRIIGFIAKIRDIVYKALEIFMFTTPVAVFSLMSSTVKNYGTVLLGVGFKYILTAYLVGLTILVFVMVIPASLLLKMSPFAFIKKIYRIWLMTVSTCSSSATLPYTMKFCKEDLHLSEEITDVVVPLGTTINMCGGAVSFSLLGLFCAKLFSVDISIFHYLLMVISALIINMSAPGIPNGGVVVGASFLEIMSIPLNFIGFYSGIYKLLDMLYTTINVTDDIVADIILNKLENHH